MEITIPYGTGCLRAAIPDQRLAGVIAGGFPAASSPEEGAAHIRRAMENPIGSPPLWQLARGRQKVVILASDHTRPVPSRLILPPMLAEIRRGSPHADITILVATGCHRGTTPAELELKFGREILERERIVIHDCDAREEMTPMGTLPSGAPYLINRLAAEADLLAAEGFIEPHFFAGYSGGRKSVMPGVASRETVHANHCSAFIAHPGARCGVLEQNPIHRDMVFAARAAKLRYIVNVVLGGQKEVIGAFAGHFDEAHLAGCRFVDSFCRRPAVPAEIVLVGNSGYPLDQNLYQAVKGMTAAEATCKEGGAIIMAAQCGDGVGGDSFYQTFAGCRDADAIARKILAVGQMETEADQWQAQIFARVLQKHPVILISDLPPRLVREMHLIPAQNPEEALRIADGLPGSRNGRVTVIPDGISVIIR